MSGNATADDILKKLHDVQEHVANTVDKNSAELNQRVDAVAEDAKKALDEVQAWRRENVNIDVPPDDIQALYLEQKGGLFGGKFRMPYKKMISLPPTSMLNASEQERVNTIHNLHDACALRWYALAKEKKTGQDDSWVMRQIAETDDFKLYVKHLEQAGYMKAGELIDPSATPGSYLDFTLLSSQLIGLVREGGQVAPLIPRITLTRANQDFPAFRGDTEAVLGSGLATSPVPFVDHADLNTAPHGDVGLYVQPTLGEIGFSAVHCIGALAFTDDQIEDSIVPILPMLREQASIMITRALDHAIISGDDTATHMDAVAAPSFQKAWDGLRFAANSGVVPGTSLGLHTTDDGGAFDANTVATAIQLMGKYAQNPESVYALVNVIDWLKLASDNDLKTVQNFGIDRAGLREGVVRQVYGVNMVVSEFVPRDLDVLDGQRAGADNRAAVIFFRPDRWWLAQKNELNVESVRVAAGLANYILADLRVDFMPLDLNKGTAQFGAGPAPVEVKLVTL